MIALLLTSLLTLVQLNCENLFDCRHDTLKNDLEFTPEGEYQWTRSRYFCHLNNTARTILACSEVDSVLRVPDLVTLCEVENDTVMTDLTRRSMLREMGYSYVMTSSADARGIDVALLYSTFTVELLSWHSVRVAPEADESPTRDLLYAQLCFLAADTVHLIALHAPSRRGGKKRSSQYRMRVAETVAAIADSVKAINPRALILVAGDFNDYHNSPTIRMLGERGLKNVSSDAKGLYGVNATYLFRRHWQSLDHVLSSTEMAQRKLDCYIGDYPFLLVDADNPRRVRPRRSFLGTNYQYGYSDHLPLIVRFKMNSGF